MPAKTSDIGGETPTPLASLSATDSLVARKFWHLAAAALCPRDGCSGQSPMCIMRIDGVHIRTGFVGDRVAVRWQLTATHDGKPFEQSIMAIYRFEMGRIAEDWGVSPSALALT